MPGAGGIATARSMARHYACLANGGELDGVRLMRPETLAAGRRELNRFMDPFIGEAMAFGTAYALQTEQGRFGPPADAFGHSGAGGSIHCAWPSQGLGLSYVMNEMRADPQDLRTRGMLKALHQVVAETAIEARRRYAGAALHLELIWLHILPPIVLFAEAEHLADLAVGQRRLELAERAGDRRVRAPFLAGISRSARWR